MGVGNAELLTSMIDDEKERAEEYLKKLTNKMKENHVSNTAELLTAVSIGCFISHDNFDTKDRTFKIKNIVSQRFVKDVNNRNLVLLLYKM